MAIGSIRVLDFCWFTTIFAGAVDPDPEAAGFALVENVICASGETTIPPARTNLGPAPKLKVRLQGFAPLAAGGVALCGAGGGVEVPLETVTCNTATGVQLTVSFTASWCPCIDVSIVKFWRLWSTAPILVFAEANCLLTSFNWDNWERHRSTAAGCEVLPCTKAVKKGESAKEEERGWNHGELIAWTHV